MPRRNKQPPIQESAPEPAEQSIDNLDMTDFAPAKAAEELPQRPTGPRQKSPHEPRNVFDGVEAGFKLDQTPEERIFRFEESRKPSAEEKAELAGMGFQYRPGVKRWAAPATPEVREASDKFALRLSGKDRKLGFER